MSDKNSVQDKASSSTYNYANFVIYLNVIWFLFFQIVYLDYK